MQKIAIYNLDEVPEGETGVYENFPKWGYEEKENGFYKEGQLVAQCKDGNLFDSEYGTLELHIYSCPDLERRIEDLFD